MNRRTFLASAGATCLASTLPSTLYAQSSGPALNLLNASINAHTIVTANSYNSGGASATDWRNAASAHNALLTDYTAKNLDAVFLPAVQGVQAANLNPSVVNQQQVLQQLQIYQPSLTIADVQSLYSTVPSDTGSIYAQLTKLQQYGMSTLLKQIVDQCNIQAGVVEWANAKAPMGRPRLIEAGFRRVRNSGTGYHPGPQPISPVGGGGSNCQQNGALLFGAGTALLVIGVLAAPEVGILALSFWGPLSFWGGVGVGAMTAVHVADCGF